jgi:hypothetical protein
MELSTSTIEKDPNGLSANAPGAKLDDGKVKAGVLEDFSRALWEVAKVGTFGAVKYSRGGWQFVWNGEERYKDAKWRHILKRNIEGQIDSDSQCLHLAQEAWNALAQLELYLRNEEPKAIEEVKERSANKIPPWEY